MRGFALAMGVVAVLAAAVLVPTSVASAPASVPALTVSGAVTGFDASATWNGHSVASASTPGSALSASFGTPVTVNFSWATRSPGTGPTASSFGITDAILHLVYLGQNVWTKDQSFSPALSSASGSYALSADLSESRYLVEGLFLVQAVLLSDTHGAVWTQSFYVDVVAPYHLTVAVVALALLGIYELVSLARVGPQSAPKPQSGTPPPAPATAVPSTTEPAPPASSEPPK